MASHCHRRPLSTALAVEKQMLCSPPANSLLHAPFTDGCVFDVSEEEVLDEQSDQDDGSEAGVDLRDLQPLLVHAGEQADRKSVVWGKRGSDRVEKGGGVSIKKT